MPIEVLRTVQRGRRSGDLSDTEAARCAAAVASAEIDYAVPHAALLAHVWSIKDNVNLYDAPYVSLALGFGVPLVTADRRLAGAARQLGAAVIVPA